jgi:hypothetical protein
MLHGVTAEEKLVFPETRRGRGIAVTRLAAASRKGQVFIKVVMIMATRLWDGTWRARPFAKDFATEKRRLGIPLVWHC